MYPIEIITNIWLCDFNTLKKYKSFIDEKNIKLILNCSLDVPYLKYMTEKCKTIRIKIDDNFNTDIKYLMKINNFIYSNYIKNDLGVLFYCYTGCQLSVSIISSFILSKSDITVINILNSIQSKNKNIIINDQLKNFLNKYLFIKK
jgi:hypothetical protein